MEYIKITSLLNKHTTNETSGDFTAIPFYSETIRTPLNLFGKPFRKRRTDVSFGRHITTDVDLLLQFAREVGRQLVLK